ncbi:hypothetical protein JW698_00495 [Candidatus Wolfebacteria bacterium]|nr:hypothetical protein [Candidatus Wolfebacteria bacterium]
MEKSFGFIAVILVWGGLAFFFFNSSILSELGVNKFLGSGISSFSENLKEQNEIINILKEREKLRNDVKDFQSATVYFDKKINILNIEFFPEKPEFIFAGSNKGLFISKDSGLNWYNFSDIEYKINSNSIVYKILFNKINDCSFEQFLSVFFDGKGVIYKSNDNFFSLEEIFKIENEAIYDFETDGENLYLGLSDGRLLALSLINNETRVLNYFESAISELKIIPEKGWIYLKLKSGGFFMSKDKGGSFKRLEFLDNYKGANKINDFQIYNSNPFLIYAATDYGLIRSFDAGDTWKVFKTIPSEKKEFSALAIDNNSEEIFAASNGKIYYSRDSGFSWRIIETNFDKREISTIELINDKIIIGSEK